ncbi:Tau-tubulin kinase 1 [Dirofilaria immitis]|nr:Tau-tubulin kinase 1 [Dirofilaria immitis]
MAKKTIDQKKRNIEGDLSLEKSETGTNTEFIGKGAFGCVYKVGYHGERYAMKFDLGYNAEEKPLLIEKRVLELAKRADSKHLCRLIDHGNYFGTEYIVMTLVGKSLRNDEKKLSAGCVISVGLQCVEAIEELHRVGFIHRDIKPSNFATGRNDLANGARKIFLIDFGLSYHYVDAKDQLKHSMTFKGTLRYAPLGCHRRRPPGRRDDLESWMYQQIEFTKGWLPWKNLDDEEAIMNVKLLRKILFEARLQEYPYDWEYEPLRYFRRKC